VGRDLERLAREIEELRAELDALLGTPGHLSVTTERTEHLAGCLLRGEDPAPMTSAEEELLRRMREYLPIYRELEEEGAFDHRPA
jgi:hypothetical protein